MRWHYSAEFLKDLHHIVLRLYKRMEYICVKHRSVINYIQSQHISGELPDICCL